MIFIFKGFEMDNKKYAEITYYIDRKKDNCYLKIIDKIDTKQYSYSSGKIFGKEFLYVLNNIFTEVYVYKFLDEEDLKLALIKLAKYLDIDVMDIKGGEFLFENDIEWRI